MRRPALLIAGASLWLFLAAIPVLADGGVHVADTNSGYSTLTADSCAGCHRAHTAQGAYLIRATSEEALCLTCHGAASTGATTDVETGLQYQLAGSGDPRDTGILGALRAGGFEQARLDTSNPDRITYPRTASENSFRAKVSVTSPADVTSAHLKIGTSAITPQGKLWGNGAAGSGVGATNVELECTSCHNPHGNGQYRILNDLPAVTGTGFTDPVAIPISGVSATTDRFTTTRAHGFVVGDIVTISGVTGASTDTLRTISAVNDTTDTLTTSTAHTFVVGDPVAFVGGPAPLVDGTVYYVVTSATPDFQVSATLGGAPVDITATTTGGTVYKVAFNLSAQYIVKSIPNGVTFTVAPAPTKTTADVTGSAYDFTRSGTGGTVQRFTALVDDAALPQPGDVRNYTVMEVRGYQGTPATYLLYASDVLNARGDNGFNIVADIVGMADTGSVTISGVSYPITDFFTTGLAHGFAVGDSVDIAGLSGFSVPDGTYTISAIPSTTTFKLTGVTGLTLHTAAGTIGARLGTATKFVPGSFTTTSGDYFHRTVPWNPRGVNSACPNDTFVDSSVFANQALVSACTTAQDAPNGRPATVTSKASVNGGNNNVIPSAYGQIAFNDQISAWCSACHSRYYSSTNPNPGTEPSSSTDLPRTISGIVLGTDTITLSGTLPNNAGTITSTGFSVGDVVDFVNTPTAPDLSAGTWYVVWTGTGASALSFRVSATYDGPVVDITGYSGGGTVVRLYPAASSSWWFPRPGESLYKYQHQTTTNRACVTCHVAHGSPALMDGTYSSEYTYPDGTASSDSRLLKIDNRGTCQACHDPTGTSVAGQLLPDPSAMPSVP